MKMWTILWVLLAGGLLLGSTSARAQTFTSVTWGVNRGSPTAAPVCLLKNGSCLVQIGTANLSTGAWNPGTLTQPSNDLRLTIAPGAADNYAAINTWLATSPQGVFTLGPTTGRNFNEYYFSNSIDIKTALTIDCGGWGYNGAQNYLVFAAGVDGVIQDTGSASDIRGCGIFSLGLFRTAAPISSGQTVIPGVSNRYPGTAIAAPFFTVGDGVILRSIVGADAALMTAPGAYISATNGVNSITLAPAFAATSTSTGNVAAYRLPAALATTITTVSGNNTILTTGGTYLWKSGDLIWSDAFPFGATVQAMSGTLGAQTLNVFNAYFYGGNTVNASVSHAAGSGRMWLVPAGLKRRMTGQSHNVWSVLFPVGLEMPCAGGNNCTSSHDYHFAPTQALVGRWVSGSNSGSSSDVDGEYTDYYRYGVMELGSIGSYYSNTTFEGAEYGTAYTDIVVGCRSNLSVFTGVYQEGVQDVCASATDPYNAAPSGATLNMLMIGPSAFTTGMPTISGNTFGNGPWAFSSLSAPNSYSCEGFTSGDKPLATFFSTLKMTWEWSKDCHLSTAVLGGYNTTWGYQVWRYNNTFLYGVVDPAVNSIYGGNPWFAAPSGLLLDNVTDAGGPGGGSPGQMRMIDTGTAAPAYTYSLQGDFRFNNGSAAGGAFGWCNTASGAHWYACGPISKSGNGP